MSEERIKERCKREDIALKVAKGFLEKDCYTDTELEYSLNTLLDLYNKQKEEIEEEKEKWKELFHEYNKLVGEVIDKEQDLKDSISKDKIRDKIKELEEKEKNCYFAVLITECEIKIEVLNELLEEK